MEQRDQLGCLKCVQKWICFYLYAEAPNLNPSFRLGVITLQARNDRVSLASSLCMDASLTAPLHLLQFVCVCTCVRACEVFADHLLCSRHTLDHYSVLPFLEARAIYLLSFFSGSLGCDPSRVSYLLDSLWSPHRSPSGSWAAAKTSSSSSPMSDIDCSSIFLPGHLQFLYPEASWSHLVSLHTE